MKYFDKIIDENPEMSVMKIIVKNELKNVYAQIETYFRNKFNNNPEKNKSTKLSR